MIWEPRGIEPLARVIIGPCINKIYTSSGICLPLMFPSFLDWNIFSSVFLDEGQLYGNLRKFNVVLIRVHLIANRTRVCGFKQKNRTSTLPWIKQRSKKRSHKPPHLSRIIFLTPGKIFNWNQWELYALFSSLPLGGLAAPLIFRDC